MLNAECEASCEVLDGCEVEVFVSGDRTCAEACVSHSEKDRYWSGEPVDRRFLICLSSLGDCGIGDCSDLLTTYDECLNPEPDLPANADSCVLAKNGVCDEPDGSVPGSDTSDCSAN